MFNGPSKRKTNLYTVGYINIRKQINGFTVLVQQLRPKRPYDDSYSVFCDKLTYSFCISSMLKPVTSAISARLMPFCLSF
jgi:hypothetical protein